MALLDQVIGADFPFLGACYGIGMIGSHQRAVVDRRYAEPVGCVPVTLTAQGRADPLLRGLPGRFDAFVGHKEAISRLPGHAVLLASSAALPGAGVPGRRERLRHPVPPRTGRGRLVHQDRRLQARRLLRAGAGRASSRHSPARSDVTHPPAILRQFVQRYARSGPASPESAAGAVPSPGRPEPSPGRPEPEPGPHAAVPAGPLTTAATALSQQAPGPRAATAPGCPRLSPRRRRAPRRRPPARPGGGQPTPARRPSC